ncbi:glycosyltransferase family 4 protein [Winogradskyella bathintestinalis]|uniref:Glycosyltransferase family 4 protein n=1 Tax=Winogradskyella bathintestinalis TaxID=3035208 RepID=A0ABT7ZUC0_9FLAO|nr:glycosyltransferase family 4 protein [Winogradskyella bathintestinalis]MDN3492414.1 glycosyltransferase family 4 protein [Winogradskyella bathintestinalis]
MIIGVVLGSAPGYSETFFSSKIQGLQQSGHQVLLFSGDNSNDFKLCPVILFPKQYQSRFKQAVILIWVYLSLLPFFKSVFKFVKMERHDGISWIRISKSLYSYAPIFKNKLDWLHFGFGTLALGGENLAASKQAKMAVSFRGFDIGVYPIKHPHCYRRLWDKVFKIHVISDDIAQLTYQHGFKDQAPIVKITPAIDTKYFSESNKTLIDTPIQMVTIARLHWKKGLNYTLEALSILKKAGFSFQYRIIGTGSEIETLKFTCYQLGLEKEVLFLGKLAHLEVKQQLEQSQIYIQYSVQEGFCNAVLEAQAMGLLCVVSDAEGLQENVLHNQTGWVVPKRQPQLLADKIIEVIELTEAKKKHIIERAILRVKKEFNIQKQQQEFLHFYEE